MSDNEKNNGAGKAHSGWTDKERLVYMIGLLENTGTKLDFKNAPRPNGRSEIACERMVGRLKTAYKTELEALKAGQHFDGEATPKKRGAKAKGAGDGDGDGDGEGTPKTATPKRKGKAAAADEDDASPKKKGRKAAAVDVKAEVKDELQDDI
ncbi:hypothetical protein P171DRAFT_431386 [Karstenula rhodostoma CBS 690.94]|uniref:Uncharacterized protein n=1 Tax=Karstenula rhodostoma CBS 690.94 TaxID=1392251 RepID=A0A9P4PJ40_9PLEO|nr:hypothetical protein P171DRAFT_431386 [Karstenula rhodostoma CBS 690.94]